MIELRADKAHLTVLRREYVTSGSSRVYHVRFFFSNDWDRYNKFVVFKIMRSGEEGNETSPLMLPFNNVCTIPSEILMEPNVLLYIGIYGVEREMAFLSRPPRRVRQYLLIDEDTGSEDEPPIEDVVEPDEPGVNDPPYWEPGFRPTLWCKYDYIRKGVEPENIDVTDAMKELAKIQNGTLEAALEAKEARDEVIAAIPMTPIPSDSGYWATYNFEEGMYEDTDAPWTGEPGEEGPAGKSAYDIAVENGFVGTPQEWLESLVGPPGPEGPEGPQGEPGKDGVVSGDGDVTVIEGPPGPQGEPGEQGLSAYEVAVENGFSGTEAQWLASLVGPEGPPGPQGEPGKDGSAGTLEIDSTLLSADGVLGVSFPNEYVSSKTMYDAMSDADKMSDTLYIVNEQTSRRRNAVPQFAIYFHGQKISTATVTAPSTEGITQEELDEALSEKQDVFSVDGTLDMSEENVLGVTTPVKSVTQTEYDLLPDKEKQEGLYVITDAMVNLKNRSEVYSTEETVIGTWIDGNPLYRKVVNASGTFKMASVQTIYGLDTPKNIDRVVTISGYAVNVDAPDVVFPLGSLWGSVYYDGSLDAVSYYPYFSSSGSASIELHIIFEYTKTTDQEVSG